jgi:hypothetical protein
LSLHALIPQPDKFLKSRGERDWCVVHWGTKWDVESRIIQEGEEILEYGFDSAWAPPLEWLERVGPQFPKLSFRLWYAEGGAYYAGVSTVEGDNVSHTEKDYVEAQIEERGSYEVQCEYCDAEMDIFHKAAAQVCEGCLQHLCGHCKKHEDTHIEGKCPFESTMFKNISPEKRNDS